MAAKKAKKKAVSEKGCSGCCCGGHRGAELSISTIIIAVIGLIVLVVLITIFTGQTGKWGKGVSETTGVTCTTGLGGQWADTCAGEVLYGVTSTSDIQQNAGKVCCKTTRSVTI